jgi:transcription initiation factor TFIIB
MEISGFCSGCNSRKTITDVESGEIVCGSCGLVITEKSLDQRPEWRAFTGDEFESRKRTGDPTSLGRHDRGLTTVISKADRDSTGRILDPAVRYSMHRLRMWNARTQTDAPGERALRHALMELDKLRDKMALPEATAEKTAYIYRKAVKHGLNKGRSIRAVLAAAIYIACRESGQDRRIREIAKISNITQKEIARSYRMLVLELDLKVPQADPIKCINVIANRGQLSEKTKREAIKLMKKVVKTKISAGKDPMGLAASVLYMACLGTGEAITQKELARTAGVTEVTVRNRCKNLSDSLELNYNKRKTKLIRPRLGSASC